MAVTHSPTVDLSLAWIMEPVPAAHWLVILPVALCIGLGAVLLMLRGRMWLQPFIAIPGFIVVAAMDTLLLAEVVRNGPITMVMGRWLPPFGIAFTVDVLGALMALAAAIVALCGAIYAEGDINDSGRRYGFYPFLMLLLAGVSGAFLTGDIFNLYVWFEVLLISSFGLLILGSEREQIDGAMKYAVLNLVGTTLFLIAVGYLYAIFGTLNMADIAEKARAGIPDAPILTLSALFILAFGMKAAAFPVNFWLPASYHTPRITVSALFAGLLTKVGVYALIRVMVMLLPAGLAGLSGVLAVSAGLTMVLGALGAMAQNDLRRMFGYLVISGIGSMLAGVAIGTPGALSGAIFYALHSIVLMTALYLMAGAAARLGNSFRIAELGGIYARSPWFAGLSLALLFAASGLPPFSGLWPKVMLVEASLQAGSWWLAAAILVSGFVTTIALGRMFLIAYWRPVAADAGEAVAAVKLPTGTLLPLVALSALVIYFGFFPDGLIHLAQVAADGILNPQSYLNSVFPAGGA